MSVWMFMIRPVAMAMTVCRADVECTALRLKRRLDFRDAAPQAPDHVDDHVIVTDTQAITQKLCRQLAVAQMPGVLVVVEFQCQTRGYGHGRVPRRRRMHRPQAQTAPLFPRRCPPGPGPCR